MNSWQDHADCKGCTDLFYPGRGETDVWDAAKAICAGCPVRGECLDHAIANGERYGVWGGTTAVERRLIRHHIRQAVRGAGLHPASIWPDWATTAAALPPRRQRRPQPTVTPPRGEP